MTGLGSWIITNFWPLSSDDRILCSINLKCSSDWGEQFPFTAGILEHQ